MLEPGVFKPLVDALLSQGDSYMILADLRAYIHTQDRVDTAYKDRRGWARKAILNVARAGKFSSDRTIREYASEIWHVDPCEISSDGLVEDGGEPGLRVQDVWANGAGMTGSQPVRAELPQ
jgi:starch phosphorylase